MGFLRNQDRELMNSVISLILDDTQENLDAVVNAIQNGSRWDVDVPINNHLGGKNHQLNTHLTVIEVLLATASLQTIESVLRHIGPLDDVHYMNLHDWWYGSIKEGRGLYQSMGRGFYVGASPFNKDVCASLLEEPLRHWSSRMNDSNLDKIPCLPAWTILGCRGPSSRGGKIAKHNNLDILHWANMLQQHIPILTQHQFNDLYDKHASNIQSQSVFTVLMMAVGVDDTIRNSQTYSIFFSKLEPSAQQTIEAIREHIVLQQSVPHHKTSSSSRKI